MFFMNFGIGTPKRGIKRAMTNTKIPNINTRGQGSSTDTHPTHTQIDTSNIGILINNTKTLFYNSTHHNYTTLTRSKPTTTPQI